VEKKTLISLVTVAFLALSSLGFVVSLGSPQNLNFQYRGQCTATVNKIKDSSWIVYTLKDLNIPGTPTDLGVETVPTEEVRQLVKENNLLYWTNALVDFQLRGRRFQGEAYVLGGRQPGDEVLLDCYANVVGGRLVDFRAIEIPPVS